MIAGSDTENTEISRAAALLEEYSRQRAFYENALAALPVRLMVVDSALRVLYANPAYCGQRGLTVDEVSGRSVTDLFPTSLLEDAGLLSAINSTVQTGERVQWSGYRHATPDHGERTLNIRMDPLTGACGEPLAMLTIEDVTERHRQLYERSVLQQLARAMLGMLKLPRLLHAILTGMTAGGAVGLGFNRAFLMLADETTGMLHTEMAVGPTSPSEAGHIWAEVDTSHTTIGDFLDDYDHLPPPEQGSFYTLVAKLEVPLTDVEKLPMLALETRQTQHVVNAYDDSRVPDSFRQYLQAEEFVVAPLFVSDARIGVAYADNFISRHPISRSDVQLFTSLANHAALAIDRARAYEQEQRRARELEEAYTELEAAQERSLRAESLAAIGEMAAIVAHEIRNPLSTIGGFANLMVRQADDPAKVARNSTIIYDEVMRLEKIVNGLLAFSRPGVPHFEWCGVSETVHDCIERILAGLDRSNVEVSVDCADNLPAVYIDRAQVYQVLDNLVRNAIEAMPDGGWVRVSARAGAAGEVTIEVNDTGRGIPPESIDSVFKTFFTTKPTGMGLGLALSKKIIHDHGAEMLVTSKVDEGTTFRLVFPTDYGQLRAAGLADDAVTDNSSAKGGRAHACGADRR